MNKYFLTDLDGTLLKNDTSLSSKTIEVVSEALNQGIVMSYSTARSYTSSFAVTSSISWQYPIILYNGAVIFDPVKKKLISGQFLDNKISNSIISLGKTNNLTPLLFCLDEDDTERVLHEKLKRIGDIQFVNSRKNDPRFLDVGILLCPDKYRTISLTFIGFKNELQALMNVIESKYENEVHIHFTKDNYIKDHYFLEISDIKANKGKALIEWSNLVGCKPSEVTVFGDNLNDVEMFNEAGKKVAVSNGHVILKEKADVIALSNEEDGVASYINNIINK